MGKIATFKSRYKSDGRIFIPKEIVSMLSLKNGEQVEVMIEKEKFDRQGFLDLFGIWKDKAEEEINIYRRIVKEREEFGRGEIGL